MRKILLAIFLGVLFGASPSSYAAEDDPPEAQETCDTEADENCVKDEAEELERGFDPCLINASLPACKSDADSDGSGATERAPSNNGESGDSG